MARAKKPMLILANHGLGTLQNVPACDGAENEGQQQDLERSAST